MSVTRARLDKTRWQQLVKKQSVSGLSGAEFCRQHDVKYASFMGWRKRLLQTQSADIATAPPKAFVELTAPLPSASTLLEAAKEPATVCVELSLGDGIELRISRRA